MANAHEFIMGLSDQYDTLLGNKGKSILKNLNNHDLNYNGLK
jgi:hypothetical protein